MTGLPDSVPEQPDHPGWHFGPDGQARRDGVDLPPPAADDAMLYPAQADLVLRRTDAIARANEYPDRAPARMRRAPFVTTDAVHHSAFFSRM